MKQAGTLRSALLALLVAAPLAGCASGTLDSALYLTPYKFEDMSCADLSKHADEAAKKLAAARERRRKVSSDPAGPVIDTVVNGPEASRAEWEHRLYGNELARKNCPPQPPPAPDKK